MAFLFSSCEIFKLDNYPEPAEILKGEVTDIATGEKVLTDQGGEGIRIRMRDLSWTQTATPANFDFYCMKEGVYQNTKVFAGHYNIRIDGPFIPLVRLNARGDTIADESKYIDIKGVTVLNFQVQPFLRIEWVKQPYLDNDVIRASIKVTRAVSNSDFRNKIEPMGSWNDNFLDVTDIRFFISESAYVGFRDSNGTPYSRSYNFTGNSFETTHGFDKTFELESLGKVPPGRTVFVRAAARIRYQTESISRYNYNEAVRVDIPQRP
jgi:hypothetical protein